MEKIKVLDDILLNTQDVETLMRECGVEFPHFSPPTTTSAEEIIEIIDSPRKEPRSATNGGSLRATEKPRSRSTTEPPMPKLRRIDGALRPIMVKIKPPVAPIDAIEELASLDAALETAFDVPAAPSVPQSAQCHQDFGASDEPSPNRFTYGKNMAELMRTTLCTEDADPDYSSEESPRRIFLEAKKKLRGLKCRNSFTRSELLEERAATGTEIERLHSEMERLQRKREEIDAKLQELQVGDHEIETFLKLFEM